MPQLNITIDTLTSMVVVEEHFPFADDLLASLSDLLGPQREIACAAPAEVLAPPIASSEEIADGPYVRISGYWHNSLIEGPGRRSTAKLQGCTIRCGGCITPDSWAVHGGALTSANQLSELLLDRRYARDGISILGGEPFLQPNGLLALIRDLRTRGCQHILVYSGYTYKRLRRMGNDTPAIGTILDDIDILVDGPYIASLAATAGPWTGSGNQRVIDLVETRRAGEIVLLDAVSCSPTDEHVPVL